MEHAFNLLDHQPSGCPRWEICQNASGKTIYVKHMFLFEADEFGREWGRLIPACRFVDGAEWVGRADSIERELSSDSDPLCQDCMEVSLQHGLSRSVLE